MHAAQSPTSASPVQRGFTLIELMVGLALGLLAVLVITQVLAMAEGKKRSVSTGSDAQINGALSLFSLQRDIQMAGYGVAASPDALGCTVKGQFDSTGMPFSFPLAPVIIGLGATSDAPNTITVLQARVTGFSVPMLLTEIHPQTGTYFIVNSSFGAAVNNLMIAVPKLQGASTWCTLFNVTNDTSSAATTLGPTRVPHVTGTEGKWNQSSRFPAADYPAGSYLLNMGAMLYRTYSVNNAQNLQVTELSPVTGVTSSQDLYPQIVNLQALYGKDTNGDGVVDTYDNITPTTNADWLQVLSIRIAVVARSNQYEKNVVTASAPQWDVGTTATISGPSTTTCNGASKCIALKVSQLTDWQHYRYKIYDTIVPLRNMLWNS